MIWKFDNSQVYILASIHFMKGGDNNHIDIINNIYDKVSKVIFETSLDPEQNILKPYQNDKLSDNISKSLLRDTKKTWLKYNLPYSHLEKSKVWLVAKTIEQSIYYKNKFLAENGIDRLLWNKSEKDKKKIEWLESQDAGMSYFDNSPIKEQNKSLINAVRNKNQVIEKIIKIIKIWNTSDEEQLSCFFNSLADDFPILFRGLIIERNSLWINKFISVLNSDIPTLFVVGALHCVGTCSIQNMLLEQYGYTSKIIKYLD